MNVPTMTMTGDGRCANGIDIIDDDASDEPTIKVYTYSLSLRVSVLGNFLGYTLHSLANLPDFDLTAVFIFNIKIKFQRKE